MAGQQVNLGSRTAPAAAPPLLPEQKIATLVGDVRNLPTPPVVLAQINRLIGDDRTSAYDLAGIIAEDPALAAKLLQLSNSAFFGLSQPVPTVKQAVVVLGMSEVRNVVLSAAVFAAFSRRPQDREYHESFWRHSLAVAVASRLLVRLREIRGFLEAETAFSAGLLHDIGKIVLLCYAPAEHHRVAQLQAARPLSDLDAEREILGIDHAQIGSFLAQRWNLPPSIVEAVAAHHSPPDAGDTLLCPPVVAVANYLAHAVFDPPEARSKALPPDTMSLERLELSPRDIEDIKSRVIVEYAKSETFLRMALG